MKSEDNLIINVKRQNIAAAVALLCACGTVASVMATPANAGGGRHKVGVCHRTASETNPYTFISVPKDEAEGHITGKSKQHNEKIVWKSDGTWRGVEHSKGDLKLDYYADTKHDCDDNTPTTSTTTQPTTSTTTSTTTQPTTSTTTTSTTTQPTTSTTTTSTTTQPTTTTSTTTQPTTTTTTPTETTSTTSSTTSTSSTTTATTTSPPTTSASTTQPPATTTTGTMAPPTSTGPSMGPDGTPTEPAPDAPSFGQLAFTGSNTVALVTVAILLLLAGIVCVVLYRRKGEHA